MTSSPAVIDTNVLIYAMDEDAPNHAGCRRLVDLGLTGEGDLCTTAQILFEYFAAVTNPRALPTPLTKSEALVDIAILLAGLRLLPSPVDLPLRVVDLLRRSALGGRQIHDVAIAATMLAEDVSAIYTFDAAFATIPGIEARTP
jgi:uncharacterized protein